MLVGWFADLYVVFAIKVLLEWLRAMRSSKWSLVKAILISPIDVSSTGFGCPTVDVIYEYGVNGELYTGTHTKPFLLEASAEELAARFILGSEFIIRINPNQPEISFMFDKDQVSLVDNKVLVQN